MIHCVQYDYAIVAQSLIDKRVGAWPAPPPFAALRSSLIYLW